MKSLWRWLRSVQQVQTENARLRKSVEQWARFAPPGHFYSPLPSQEEIEDAFARGRFGPPFPGIDLHEREQLALLEEFCRFYPEQPFPEKPTEGRRFYLENNSYGHFDAIMLYGMLRRLQPRRIIEVGSGFSSAAMLDMNDVLFGGKVALTFIDPHMDRLRKLLRPEDAGRVTLIEKRVQEAPLETFDALEANDVLFIDSSHVSKIGSDVNLLFFEVLPRLKRGVHIHIHDVALPLDYPREWLEDGRAWNEQYLLRAFLMFNRAFEIVLFSSWLVHTQRAVMRERMPMCAQGNGGQMWLRRVE